MINQAPSVEAAIAALGYTGAPGLVIAGADPPADLSTRFIWEEVVQKVELDAIFFQSGVPIVGFTGASARDLRALRQQLWNYGRLPALVSVSDGQEVTVYNAQRSPSDESGTSGILATSLLRNAGRDLNEFSRREVEAGTLARVFGGSFRASDRVDSILLANLRMLRGHLSQGGGSNALSHADVVIGASILAAYLSDRAVLTEDHLSSLCNQATLPKALSAGQDTFAALLSGLAARFNGDVFGPALESVTHLKDEDLAWIARFLRGENLASGQGSLWGYNFSAIPPEVISSVYETLLEEERQKHASFYTPRAVVNLVPDEVIPLDGTFDGSVADLSCGSGAFVTEAFRRLVFLKRVRGEAIDFHALSSVLTEHVYGIDVDDFATRLTIFGLYLALLEEVEPRTIWDEVVLPRLYMRSVVTADAFADHALQDRQFDVIVGNPPWQSALSADAVKFLTAQQLEVGDRQLAQAFVWLASHKLRPGGRLGLVLPAKSSLYNRSAPNRRFRSQLFERLRVRTIVDLSLLRRRLFAGAIGPSVVVVADHLPEPSAPKRGVYLAVRPRSGSGIIDGFVVAPEDFKEFSVDVSSAQDFAWKVLLWGSQRDLELLQRLQRTCTPLTDVAQSQGWHVAQGIKERGPQRSSADLVGLPTLNQDAMGQLQPVRFGAKFHRETLTRRQPRSFFEAPKLVVARTLSRGRIATSVLTSPAIFTSNLTGISASVEELASIRLLGLIASSSLIQYWQFFTSASWGVERPAVDTNEIRTWPLPQFDSESVDRADAVWRTIGTEGVTDENRAAVDEFVSELYRLTWSEQLLVKAGVERSMSADRPGDLFTAVVTEAGLAAYRDALVAHLSTGWESVHPTAATTFHAGYAGVKVKFEASDSIAAAPSQTEWTAEEWDRAIGSLERPASTTAVISQPSLLYFEGAAVYLVKSRDADRWNAAAALNDGDDIYAAAVFGEQVVH